MPFRNVKHKSVFSVASPLYWPYCKITKFKAKVMTDFSGQAGKTETGCLSFGLKC